MPALNRKTLHAAWRQHVGPVWKSRTAAAAGAVGVGVGLFAWGFARAADEAQALFGLLTSVLPWAPLILTPVGFFLLVWSTRRFEPLAKGAAIPRAPTASSSSRR